MRRDKRVAARRDCRWSVGPEVRGRRTLQELSEICAGCEGAERCRVKDDRLKSDGPKRDFRAPLPSLRALTNRLREMNRAFSHPAGGPEHVHLAAVDADFPMPDHWTVSTHPAEIGFCTWYSRTSVLVPGDCGDLVLVEYPNGNLDADDQSKFDAVGAARRLLASARDAGFR